MACSLPFLLHGAIALMQVWTPPKQKKPKLRVPYDTPYMLPHKIRLSFLTSIYGTVVPRAITELLQHDPPCVDKLAIGNQQILAHHMALMPAGAPAAFCYRNRSRMQFLTEYVAQ